LKGGYCQFRLQKHVLSEAALNHFLAPRQNILGARQCFPLFFRLLMIPRMVPYNGRIPDFFSIRSGQKRSKMEEKG